MFTLWEMDEIKNLIQTGIFCISYLSSLCLISFIHILTRSSLLLNTSYDLNVKLNVQHAYRNKQEKYTISMYNMWDLQSLIVSLLKRNIKTKFGFINMFF